MQLPFTGKPVKGDKNRGSHPCGGKVTNYAYRKIGEIDININRLYGKSDGSGESEP
jgi:hypothetical protein